MITSHIYESKSEVKYNVSVNKNVYTFYYPSSSLYKSSPYFITLRPGVYLFEAWGAKGGDTLYSGCPPLKPGGNGAYVSGYIKLFKITNLFLFIGSKGKDCCDNVYEYAYNGGGYAISSPSGGGSTDFRTFYDGTIDKTESLKSRILVSGAGGGSECDGFGGAGGTLTGNSATAGGKGGTQSSGGSGSSSGNLWSGGSSKTANAAGGRGGYYGGGYGTSTNTGGGGGSSYISGCNDCSPTKISDYTFFDPIMIAGNALMPGTNNSYQTGQQGNGAARITIIKMYSRCNVKNTRINVFYVLIIFSY